MIRASACEILRQACVYKHSPPATRGLRETHAYSLICRFILGLDSDRIPCPYLCPRGFSTTNARGGLRQARLFTREYSILTIRALVGTTGIQVNVVVVAVVHLRRLVGIYRRRNNFDSTLDELFGQATATGRCQPLFSRTRYPPVL